MRDFEERSSDWLDRYTNEARLLDEHLRALKSIIEEVRKSDNAEFMEYYGYFSYSLYNLLFDNLILNLSWMLEENGKRSLIWFLDQLQKQPLEYYKSLATQVVDYEPAIFHTEQSSEHYGEMKNRSPAHKDERKRIIKKRANSYKTNIDSHLCSIESLQEIYLRLKGARDQSIAHRDKTAFDNPKKFWEDNQLSIEDIETLTHTVIDIVKDIFGMMNDAELEFLPSSKIGLDTVLWRLKECHKMETDYLQQRF